MKTQFTKTEQVIAKATYDFHIQQGATEKEANERVMYKILQVRALVKKEARYFKH